MLKVFKLLLILLVIGVTFLGLNFYIGMSGGIKGLWYDFTKPTLDPYNATITQKRARVADRIIPDFNFIDAHPALVKYGVHNTDLCTKADYSYTRPLSIYSHLYECKYVSQRYYGVIGDYESTVKNIISYIEKNKEGLTFQPYQKEHLFKQKDWMNEVYTIRKIIGQYNIRHIDRPATNIYEVISFLEGQDVTTVYSYSPSKDRYTAKLDLIDSGVAPSSIESSQLYEKQDNPDLREQYVLDIHKNHKFGLVVTVAYSYYTK